MGFLDEVKSFAPVTAQHCCPVGRVLAENADIAADLQAALDAPRKDVPTAWIVKALRSRKHKISELAVNEHRKGHGPR